MERFISVLLMVCMVAGGASTVCAFDNELASSTLSAYRSPDSPLDDKPDDGTLASIALARKAEDVKYFAAHSYSPGNVALLNSDPYPALFEYREKTGADPAEWIKGNCTYLEKGGRYESLFNMPDFFTRHYTQAREQGVGHEEALAGVIEQFDAIAARGARRLKAAGFVPGIMAGGAASRFSKSIRTALAAVFGEAYEVDLFADLDARFEEMFGLPVSGVRTVSVHDIARYSSVITLRFERLTAALAEVSVPDATKKVYGELAEFVSLIHHLPEGTDAQLAHKLSIIAYLFGRDVPRTCLPHYIKNPGTPDAYAVTFNETWVQDCRVMFGEKFLLMTSPGNIQDDILFYMTEIMGVRQDNIYLFSQMQAPYRYPTRAQVDERLAELSRFIDEREALLAATRNTAGAEKNVADLSNKLDELRQERDAIHAYVDTVITMPSGEKGAAIDMLGGKLVINADGDLVPYPAGHLDYFLDMMRSGVIFQMLEDGYGFTLAMNQECVTTQPYHICLTAGFPAEGSFETINNFALYMNAPASYRGATPLLTPDRNIVNGQETYQPDVKPEESDTPASTNTFLLSMRGILSDVFGMDAKDIARARALVGSEDFSSYISAFVQQGVDKLPAMYEFKAPKPNDNIADDRSFWYIKNEGKIDALTAATKTVGVYGLSNADDFSVWKSAFEDKGFFETSEESADLLGQVYARMSLFSDAKTFNYLVANMPYQSLVLERYVPSIPRAIQKRHEAVEALRSA